MGRRGRDGGKARSGNPDGPGPNQALEGAVNREPARLPAPAPSSPAAGSWGWRTAQSAAWRSRDTPGREGDVDFFGHQLPCADAAARRGGWLGSSRRRPRPSSPSPPHLPAPSPPECPAEARCPEPESPAGAFIYSAAVSPRHRPRYVPWRGPGGCGLGLITGAAAGPPAGTHSGAALPAEARVAAWARFSQLWNGV